VDLGVRALTIGRHSRNASNRKNTTNLQKHYRAERQKKQSPFILRVEANVKQPIADPLKPPANSPAKQAHQDDNRATGTVATGILALTRDAAARDLLMEIALERGFGLCSAADIAEAVRVLDNQPPVLVIVDLDSSEGRALLSLLRAQERWRRIPLFALTATNNPMVTVTIDAPVFFMPDLGGLQEAVVGRLEPPAHTLSDELSGDLSNDLAKLGTWPRRTPSA
jgi:CheY-like chemotaxis protein